jgi:hypothetical protein
MYYSTDESVPQNRRSSTFSLGNNRTNLLTSFMRKFTNEMTNSTYDKLNRTSTCCFSASLPTQEINHWVENACLTKGEKVFLFNIGLY